MTKTGPSIDVVKREDKEARLKDFIQGSIITTVEGDGTTLRYLAGTLIARSVTSPVVLALAAVTKDQPDLIVALRTLLLVSEPASAAQEEAARTFSVDIRAITDARILNAHEQLVLGPSVSWIGDCMRREPAKRDAYECYAVDSVTTANWARMAFNRLWEAGKPLKRVDAKPLLREEPADAVAPTLHEAPHPIELQSTTTVSTRH